MHLEREDRSDNRANGEPLTPQTEPESADSAASEQQATPQETPLTEPTEPTTTDPQPLHAAQPDSIASDLHIGASQHRPEPDSASETATGPDGPSANTGDGPSAEGASDESPSGESPTAEKTQDDAEAELWLDGENFMTLLLRSLCTLLAGGFLAWAQYQAPIQPGAEWGRWIWTSVIANFLLPLFVVWMFFAQQLRPAEWLQDQKFNAWNYGWNFREWRRHVKLALIMFAVMLPFIWWASRDTGAHDYYRNYYFPPVTDARSWLWLLGTLTLYMFCWEWFNRGFLLFGLAQGLGPWLAILLQAAMFAASHYGKPQAEFIGAFGGGLVLGIVAWREKSFVPAFYTHALVHIAWAILVLR